MKVSSHQILDDAEETLFAEALDGFSNKVWSKARKSRSIKFDLAMLVNPEEEIEVPSLDNRTMRKLSRQSLAEVVGPRYRELFGMVQAELRRSGLEHQVSAGIVLTGGSSRIEGCVELAEEVFGRHVLIPSQDCLK